jgi:hypothetical protein
MLQTIIAICAGVSLGAACGFRVFIPPLALAIATRAGVLPVHGAPAWIGATPTLIVLIVAALTEVVVYKVPWLDHLMDAIATPSAIAAGIGVCVALLPEDQVPPAAKWAIAVVLGGGAAGAVQGGTVAVRAASGAATGGAGNPLVSKVENLAAGALSVLALAVPIAAVIVLLLTIWLLAVWFVRLRRRGASVPPAASTS